MVLPLLLMTLPQGGMQIMMYSFGIAVAMAALFQILAAFYQNAQFKAIANEELAALLFSVFIIAFWLGTNTFFESVVSSIMSATLPGGAPITSTTDALINLPIGHIQFAILQTKLFQAQLVGLYLRLAAVDVLISFMSTLSFNVGVLPGGAGIFSLHIAPYVPLSLISNAMTTIVDGIGLLGLTMWGKEMLLILTQTVVPLILLPLGIIMRANPFSRTTGSSLIALCFAIYFVYPLTVMFSYHALFDVYGFQTDYRYTDFTTPFKTRMDSGAIEGMQSDIQKGDAAIQGETEKYQGQSSEQVSKKACGEGFVASLLCSADKMVKAVDGVPLVGGFVTFIWNQSKVMISYSGGFWSFLFSPNSILLPSGVIFGMYTYLTDAVAKTVELFVLTTVATVLEIMVTITMYRNIALLIGGDPEIAGISKIV
ncbi:MAG: hypothetical protein V1492_02330 [Candidatus Micrarchaeota archaeon]